MKLEDMEGSFRYEDLIAALTNDDGRARIVSATGDSLVAIPESSGDARLPDFVLRMRQSQMDWLATAAYSGVRHGTRSRTGPAADPAERTSQPALQRPGFAARAFLAEIAREARIADVTGIVDRAEFEWTVEPRDVALLLALSWLATMEESSPALRQSLLAYSQARSVRKLVTNLFRSSQYVETVGPVLGVMFMTADSRGHGPRMARDAIPTLAQQFAPLHNLDAGESWMRRVVAEGARKLDSLGGMADSSV